MAQEIIYIKPDSECTRNHPHITIGDVMKVECSNEGILRKVKQMELYRFTKPHSAVISVLAVIARIHEDYPNLNIVNCGEEDFIIEYLEYKEPTKVSVFLENIKLILVAFLVLLGSAFTIMAFHNDVDIQGVFERFYLQIMGTEKPPITVLEVSYCTGIGVGIMVFYNHFRKQKRAQDPTPIEVELKKYNKDLNSSKVDIAEEKGHKVDVT